MAHTAYPRIDAFASSTFIHFPPLFAQRVLHLQNGCEDIVLVGRDMLKENSSHDWRRDYPLLINIIVFVISAVLKLSVTETGIHHQISFQIAQCQQRD